MSYLYFGTLPSSIPPVFGNWLSSKLFYRHYSMHEINVGLWGLRIWVIDIYNFRSNAK